MRPGLIAGRYPEKDEQEDESASRMTAAFSWYLKPLGDYRQASLKTISDEIDYQGSRLKTLAFSRLCRITLDFKRLFRTQGLRFHLCIRAFALIREIASRTIHKRHFDVQLMAGWVMLQGQLAEMETGEGKTLAATLAAGTAALAGIPVHVLTVNEYLVRRDEKLMRPLFRALGLTVGTVTQDMPIAQRRAGYACDIVYVTSKQVQFDYLRDRLILGNDRNGLRLQLESAYAENDRLGQLLLRGLCFGIVDEADSILIDEARTPLILSRTKQADENGAAFRHALHIARILKENKDFLVDKTRRKRVELTLPCQERLRNRQVPFQAIGKNAQDWEQLIVNALYALHVLRKDHDYLVKDNKVMIVDSNTGRVMPDRSWEKGLQQLIEAKERCPLTALNVPMARLTTQRFFRRYLHLGGMTGTAREVGPELWSVYNLRVRRIPLHRQSRRMELPTRIFYGVDQKWAALALSVKKRNFKGQPVLVGTGSVEESEALSSYFATQGIAHQVLNARQDKTEADIVAKAGHWGQVTIATNMAGRGTDIPLADGVAAVGGLHVIALCRNIARRIDRQLMGRCARQGDPGSYRVMLSLEDSLVRRYGHAWVMFLMSRFANENGEIPGWLGAMVFRIAQQKVERQHFYVRKQLLKQEKQICRMLAFSGTME